MSGLTLSAHCACMFNDLGHCKVISVTIMDFFYRNTHFRTRLMVLSDFFYYSKSSFYLIINLQFLNPQESKFILHVIIKLLANIIKKVYF